MKAIVVVVLVVGCVPPLLLPDDADIACAASADCPKGVCAIVDDDEGGRCVDVAGVCFDGDDPAHAVADDTACAALDADGVCRKGDCVVPACGDGVVDAGEECDDGAANDDAAEDACRADCRAARCGDGVIDSVEECDGDDVDHGVCVGCAVVCDVGHGDCDLDVGDGCECALEELFRLADDSAPALQPEGVLDGHVVLLQHQRFEVARFALRAGALVALDDAELARFAARDDVHSADGGRVEARADGRGAVAVFVDDNGGERELVRSDDAPLPIAVVGSDVWIAVFRSASGTTLERYALDEAGAPDVVLDLSGFPTLLRADDVAVCAFGLKPEALLCRSDGGVVVVDDGAQPVFALMSPAAGTPIWLDAAGAVCTLDDDGARVVLAQRADAQALLSFAGASVGAVSVDVVTAGLAFDDDSSAADVATALAGLPAGAMVPVPGATRLRMLARGGVRGSVVVDGAVIVSDGRTVWRAPLP